MTGQTPPSMMRVFDFEDDDQPARRITGRTAAPDSLADLRAEVVALRDEADERFARSSGHRQALRHEIRGERIGYRTVLDLIDKHAREGQ